ncbi:Alpha/beta hydrolase fold-1 [Xylariaceae sp. FL0662B]|nr:Alpha/beta hydrolase fold-1 [Xylariaceae sp. FL0662B]
MASAKPVILIVTGAWHLPSSYDLVKSKLEALGYEVLCPKLRTAGAGIHGVTYQADVDLIREIAVPLFDQGKEVVLVAHSYGGIPASIATDGLGVEDRAKQGRKGGFRRIIFICAFVIPKKGMDLLQTFGGEWPDWYDNGPKYTKNHNTGVNEKAKKIFYNDIPEEEAQRHFESLVPCSQDAYETPVNFIAADITIPKTYIICTKDAGLLPSLQEALVVTVSNFGIERIPAGHSPFLSQPDKTAELIAKWAEAKA